MKPMVNDPQGLTVKDSLHMLGFDSAESVRMGKYIEIKLDGENKKGAEKQVREMCQKLLANPVIENFRFSIEQSV